nr:hypothetical protein [Sphingobium sp. 15-1]
MLDPKKRLSGVARRSTGNMSASREIAEGTRAASPRPPPRRKKSSISKLDAVADSAVIMPHDSAPRPMSHLRFPPSAIRASGIPAEQ